MFYQEEEQTVPVDGGQVAPEGQEAAEGTAAPAEQA